MGAEEEHRCTGSSPTHAKTYPRSTSDFGNRTAVRHRIFEHRLRETDHSLNNRSETASTWVLDGDTDRVFLVHLLAIISQCPRTFEVHVGLEVVDIKIIQHRVLEVSGLPQVPDRTSKTTRVQIRCSTPRRPVRPTTPTHHEEASDLSAAAEHFVNDYYDALNSHRHAIPSYYLSNNANGGAPATNIIFNGIEVADGKAAQEVFEKVVSRSQIAVDSLDCQILNANYTSPQATTNNTRSTALSCSILVMVGGIFKTSTDPNEEEDDFTDTLIIVPNPEQPARRGGRHKDFLIQTQNLRLLPGEHPENSSTLMAT